MTSDIKIKVNVCGKNRVDRHGQDVYTNNHIYVPVIISRMLPEKWHLSFEKDINDDYIFRVIDENC